MADANQFKRWSLSRQDLLGLEPVKARDLILHCFFEAQRETYARAKANLGLAVTPETIRESVVKAVRAAFDETRGDFNRPTKAALLAVVGVLASKSRSWGTPPDIIEYHRGQIGQVLDLLPDAPGGGAR